jgi:hypothetical protein
MKGRTALAASAVLVAATIAGTALAASTAKNPKTLVLQKSDFPPGARVIKKYTEGGAAAGGAAYYITYRYKSGSNTRELASFALVATNGQLARAFYRELKTDVPRTRLVLPKYGDEQLAGFLGLDGAMLLVRKNTVVWSLKIEYDLDLGLTKPEALAELKRYAPKQMKRVGSG